MGVIGVPTGGYGSEGLDVVLISTRIEDEPTADGLEECEVRICLVWLLVDIVALHIVLIGIDKFHDAVVGLGDAELSIVLQVNGLTLERHLTEGQLTDLLAVVGAADGVVRRHARILALELYGLRRVDADVDDLVGDTETVELRSLCGVATEGEAAIIAQLHGVEHLDTLQTYVLEIKYRILGVGNLSLNTELVVVARCHRHCGQHHGCCLDNMSHINYYFSICGCKGTNK